jgi:hypothetical protein
MTVTISDWTKSPINANELHADASTGSHLILSQRKDRYFDVLVDGLKQNSQRLTRQAAVQFAELYVEQQIEEKLAKAEQEGKESVARVYAAPPHERQAAMEKEVKRHLDSYFVQPVTERQEAINSIAVLAQEVPVLEIPVSTEGLASISPACIPLYLGQPRISGEQMNGNTEPVLETPAMTAEEQPSEQPKKRRAKAKQGQTEAQADSPAQDHAEPTQTPSKPKQKAKEPKPLKPVDRFGSYVGSGRAKINDVLSSTPQTSREIADRAGVRLGKVAKYFRRAMLDGNALGQRLGKTEDGRWFLKEI